MLYSTLENCNFPLIEVVDRAMLKLFFSAVFSLIISLPVDVGKFVQVGIFI